MIARHSRGFRQRVRYARHACASLPMLRDPVSGHRLVSSRHRINPNAPRQQKCASTYGRINNADRMLTRQIALKSFKTVAGRRVQGLKKGGRVQHNQFSASYLGEICRETLGDHPALKDRLGKFPLEVPDHKLNVSHRDTYCKTLVSQEDTVREFCALLPQRAPLDSLHSTPADGLKSALPAKCWSISRATATAVCRVS